MGFQTNEHSLENDSHTLPLDVQPRILYCLDEIGIAYICAIANSTANFENETIKHAIFLPDAGVNDDNLGWLFDVYVSTKKGKENLTSIARFHQNRLNSILRHDLNFIKNNCINPVLVTKDVESKTGRLISSYTPEMSELEETVVNECTQGTLDAKKLLEYCQKCSYVAKGIMISLAIPSLGNRVVNIYGKEVDLEYRDTPIMINDEYIGGIRYDQGADAIAELIKTIMELHLGICDIGEIESVSLVSQAIKFLEAQGYGKRIEKLRENIQQAFVRGVS